MLNEKPGRKRKDTKAKLLAKAEAKQQQKRSSGDDPASEVQRH